MALRPLLWTLVVSAAAFQVPQLSQCGGDDDDSPTPAPAFSLSGDLTVSYDDYGVPHIYGRTLDDVAFGHGYATARDRLWQIDYRRREGHGRLAELFGESVYGRDLSARTLGLTLHAQEALDRIATEDPELFLVLEAYSAGVNAWMDHAIAGTQGASLPPQIVAIGYVPEPWSPVDSLVIDKALQYGASSSISDELTVWLMSVLFGDDLTLDVLRPQPSGKTYIVPGFYDQPAELSTEESSATTAKSQSGLTREQVLEALEAVRGWNPMPTLSGSNNWVISGDRTREGFPLLANDTHQGVDHPATYYQAHMNTVEQGGTVDMVGYGYAGMPFFLFGHNETGAIGLTRNMLDVADLYLETRVNNTVMFQGQPVRINSREETLCVRVDGGPVESCEPRPILIEEVPHHGPILPAEMTGGLPLTISVRAAALGSSSIIRVVRHMLEIQSYTDVQEALGYLEAGSQNVVYADISGNIGYLSRADIPVREQIDPLNPPYMVVPGTGGYEWTSTLVPDDLIPQTYNPATGYVVTANNDPAGLLDDNDPANGPYLDEIGAPIYLSAIYDLGFRAQRITELAEAGVATRDITVEDVREWQGDNTSLIARRMLPYLFEAIARTPTFTPSPEVDQALETLQAFDADNHRCTLDSQGALVFHTWYAYFLKAMLGDETDPSLFDNMDGTYSQIFLRPAIYFLDVTAPDIDAYDFQASGGCTTDPSNPFCSVVFPSVSGLNFFDDQTSEDRVETRDELLLKSLEDTVAMLVAQEGGTLTRTWGDVHQITFNDPASIAGYYYGANLGPYPIDGGIFTVDVADSRLLNNGQLVTTMDVGGGPSQRTIYQMDPSGIRVWDSLTGGGQSERPDMAHFDDQVDLFLHNEYRMLPFSLEEVAEAELKKLLLPAGFPASGAPVWE